MIGMSVFYKYAAIAALSLCAAISASAAPRQADIEAHRALVAQDLRLATIGYRLALANAAFCKLKSRNPGWVLHDIAQYSDQEAARAAFGFQTPVSIAAIVPGGPAALAGMKPGMAFTAFHDEGISWEAMPEIKKGFERLDSIKEIIRIAWDGENRLPIQVKQGATEQRFDFVPPSICASDFVISVGGSVTSAGGNGKTVRVSAKLAEYAPDDDELAAVVAHELSHNILEHRKKLDENKTKRGIGRLFGKSRKAILATEIEADQLSVWLMKNAGYDPRAAIRFRERIGREHGKGIFTEGTHLRWRNRVKILQAEINQIEKQPADSMPLPPPLLTHTGQATASGMFVAASEEGDEGER